MPNDMLVLAGLAAGKAGLFCLLAAMILSARVAGWDARLGGLPRLWRLHHLLGAAALLLVMAHPLLLAFSAARVSPQAAAAALFPGLSARGVWVGWLSFAALAVFLAPTFSFFAQPAYQRWKALHALSGPALALALAHGWACRRPIDGVWGVIWASLSAAALLAFVYRIFLSRLLGRRACVVSRVRREGRGTVEVTLKLEGERLRYRAGQFVYLTPLDPVLASGRGEEHPFTISSAPAEPELRIVIKDLGDATRALQGLAPASRAFVEGPYGGFFPRRVFSKELWIAGGVGLTPFLSRARGFAAGVDIRLVYCVQSPARALFLNELEAIAAKIAGFEVRPHYFERESTLSAKFLAAGCSDLSEREVFVCGPPPLVDLAREELGSLGVSPGRIHTEDFSWL